MVHRVLVGRLACVGCFLGLLAGTTKANVFTMPTGQKSLDLVTVGDVGNQPDKRYVSAGVGAVGYNYQIGKYDVTAGQYAQFLNAVATVADPYGLYNPFMAQTAVSTYVGCGIVRSGDAGSYSYSVIAGRENYPVNYVSWGDAVRFANWLSNGQGFGDTETGSYTLNGVTDNAGLMAVGRNPGATFVLPSEDEWYKAAYYKGGSTNAGYWAYPTRSDSVPSSSLSSIGTNNANFVYWSTFLMRDVYTDPDNYLTAVGAFAGSPGPYGTFDQGGNVNQWNETSAFGSYRDTRGGSYGAYGISLEAGSVGGSVPREENRGVGFRVAMVPEPTSLTLLALCGVATLIRRRRVHPR